MTDKELLQQALHWLDDKEGEYTGEYKNLIEAIKARLAQPEPKPVGCIIEVHTRTSFGGTAVVVPQMYRFLPVGTLLYTAPPEKEWAGLTDDEIDSIAVGDDHEILTFARAIEAKLKEKNSG